MQVRLVLSPLDAVSIPAPLEILVAERCVVTHSPAPPPQGGRLSECGDQQLLRSAQRKRERSAVQRSPPCAP